MDERWQLIYGRVQDLLCEEDGWGEAYVFKVSSTIFYSLTYSVKEEYCNNGTGTGTGRYHSVLETYPAPGKILGGNCLGWN